MIDQKMPDQQIPVSTIGKRLLLRMIPRRVLTQVFGDRWRLPLVRYASSPLVYALAGDTVVLGGCYQLETIRSYSRVVGSEGRIIAIEANPDSVVDLREAIARDDELNRAENITVIAKGVWDKKGQTTFVTSSADGPAYDRIDDQRLNGLEAGKGAVTKQHTIEVDSIDNMLADLGATRADYIVLTLNNSELPALDGMETTIAANPQLRMYIHSVSPHPLEQVRDKLLRQGFRIRAEPVNVGSRLHRIYAFRSPGQRQAQSHSSQTRAS